MSREKRARREQRRRDSNHKFAALVLLVADAEGRTIVGIEEFDRYVCDLKSRGVIIERGPRLRDGGQPLSFCFDRLQPGSRCINFDDVIAIFGGIDTEGRGAVA